MRKLFIWITGILVILLLAAVIIPFLIPSSVYKSAIENQLTSRFGRQVTIAGDVYVSPLPILKVHTENVQIDNPDGFTSSHFAQMESLAVRVKLLPLISRKVEISTFELVEPRISLEKLADGKVNWIMGGRDETSPVEGPFRRDGRYADIEATIGKFSISDGYVSYEDRLKKHSHRLEDVNLSMTLSSLSQPVSFEGNLLINGIAVDAEIEMSTPRSYLNGKKTPVTFNFTTMLGSIDAKGHFIESPENHFKFDVKGKLLELIQWSEYFGYSEYGKIIETVSFSGRFAFVGTDISAENADIRMVGEDVVASFKGDMVLAEQPIANGRLTFQSSNFSTLAKTFDIGAPYASILENVDLNTQFKSSGTGLYTDNLIAKISGQDFSGSFEGSAKMDDRAELSGKFSTEVTSMSSLLNTMDFENSSLAIAERLSATGTLELSDSSTLIKIENSQTESPELSTSFTGTIDLSDAINLTGDFIAETKSVSAVAQKLDINQASFDAIGELNAKGRIEYDGETTYINFERANTISEDLISQYVGSVYLTSNDVKLTGEFETSVSDLARLNQNMGSELTYADAIGSVGATGSIKGQLDELAINDLRLTLENGELNGSFIGDATYQNGLSLAGKLETEIPSARVLTKSTVGIDLPRSTASGDIYERINISGDISGTPTEIRFTTADLAMDAISGDGQLIIDLSKSRPVLNGSLDLAQLDLRPYLDAYMALPPGETGLQPWSEEPFDFTALRLMDGEYLLKTPEIIIGPLTFGQTDIDASVANGILTAQLPKVNLYGGLGVMTASLDASGRVPKVKLTVTLEDIHSNKFLASLANFTRLEGNAHTVLELSGEGRSQAEIMRSLNGFGNFEVLGGIIEGVDLSKFLSGIDESLAQRVLPDGIGKSYATKFDDMVGKFKIQDGVVSIDSFDIRAFDVLASGQGKLDIGQQSMDFSLRPRLTGSNVSDLGKFGIPLRFKGNWGAVSPGPDFELLQDIAVEKAKLRAKEEITDRVGGEIGGILDNVLGGSPTRNRERETPQDATISEPANTQPEIREDIEEHPSELTPPDDPVSSDTPEIEDTNMEEESIEKKLLNEALDGILGSGKNDD